MARREGPAYRAIHGEDLWGGEVMLELSGDPDALSVAFYVMTCPESCRTTLGVFPLSIAGMAEALGMPLPRASKALGKVSDTGLIRYDERLRLCWIVEAARHEYSERPNLEDNRVAGLVKALPALLSKRRKSFIWNEFAERYGKPWAAVWEAAGEALPEGFARALQGLAEPLDTTAQAEIRDQRSEIRDPPHKPPQGGAAPERVDALGIKIADQSDKAGRAEEKLTRIDYLAAKIPGLADKAAEAGCRDWWAWRMAPVPSGKRPNAWRQLVQLRKLCGWLHEHDAGRIFELVALAEKNAWGGMEWRYLEGRDGSFALRTPPGITAKGGFVGIMGEYAGED